LKVLVCATEAGGASNLAPVIHYGCALAEISVYACKGGLPIFESVGISATDCGAINDVEQARKLVDSIGPDVMLLGRSRDVKGAERALIRAGREGNVPTVCVVDEWHNYRLNFVDQNNKLTDLPDIICCPDQVAKREAFQEGVPESHLIDTGSPAMANLWASISTYERVSIPIPRVLENSRNEQVITFLSETIRRDHSGDGSEQDQLDPYPGYDEYTVRSDLLSCLDELNLQCTVIEKLHPSAESQDYKVPDHPRINWITVDGALSWAILWHSDLIVGMRSVALLQAFMMGLPIVSYQPNMIGQEKCTAVRLGHVVKLKERTELLKWLSEKRLFRDRKLIKCPSFARPEATQNIFETLRKLAMNSV